MNYYKFNIGDYAAATRHLSMLEHGAYRLLLDLYYTSEQPIPADIKAAARKAGARGKDEAQAVETVLGEFFTLTEKGWTHARCDAEIQAYKQKAGTNRVVGMRGGRPKKETQTVSKNNPDGYQKETQTVSKNNPNQEPLTINQEPPPNPPDAGVGVGEVISDKPPTPTKAGVICKALKAAGLANVSPQHPTLLALIDRGVTAESFADAAASAVARGKGFDYAIGILKRQLEEATVIGNLPKAQKSSPAIDPDSRLAVESEGEEKGFGRWREGRESWDDYKDRVRGLTRQRVLRAPSITTENEVL